MPKYANQINTPSFNLSDAKNVGKVKGNVVFNNGDRIGVLTAEGNVVEIYRDVNDTPEQWREMYPLWMPLELDKLEIETPE